MSFEDPSIPENSDSIQESQDVISPANEESMLRHFNRETQIYNIKEELLPNLQMAAEVGSTANIAISNLHQNRERSTQAAIENLEELCQTLEWPPAVLKKSLEELQNLPE